jgi:hypothetical protein
MGTYTLNNKNLLGHFNATGLRDTLENFKNQLKTGSFDFNVTSKSEIGYDYTDLILKEIGDVRWFSTYGTKSPSEEEEEDVAKVLINRSNFKLLVSLVKEYEVDLKKIGLSDFDAALIKGDFKTFSDLIKGKSNNRMNIYEAAEDYRFLTHSTSFYYNKYKEYLDNDEGGIVYNPAQLVSRGGSELICLVSDEGKEAWNSKDTMYIYNGLSNISSANFVLLGDGQNSLEMASMEFKSRIKDSINNYKNKLVIYSMHGNKQLMDTQSFFTADQNLFGGFFTAKENTGGMLELFKGYFTTKKSEDSKAGMIVLDACSSGAIFNSPDLVFSAPYKYIMSSSTSNLTSIQDIYKFTDNLQKSLSTKCKDQHLLSQKKLLNTLNPILKELEVNTKSHEDAVANITKLSDKREELLKEIKEIQLQLEDSKAKSHEDVVAECKLEGGVTLEYIILGLINTYAHSSNNKDSPVLGGRTASGVHFIINIKEFYKNFCNNVEQELFANCLARFEDTPESFLSEDNYFCAGGKGIEFIEYGNI